MGDSSMKQLGGSERIYLSPPHLGSDELDLVKEAFVSNWVAPRHGLSPLQWWLS
jgi:hypothetical protein